MADYAKQPRRKYCQFCKDDVEYIDYKDIQMLRKYVTDRGKIKPRRGGREARPRDGSHAVCRPRCQRPWRSPQPLSEGRTTMKVILLKELQGKGGEGDVIDVNRGFANNFLLTQGYAVKATPGNLKQLEERKKNIAKREETRIADANALAEKLNDATVRIIAQVGEEGVLFGSVTAPLVADAIAEQLDIEIDRRRVELGKPIKMAGTYQVPVSLYRDIKGTVTVVVAGESEAEEAIEAIEEAIGIAESPADETVEVDGQIAEDGTVEVEVTETEE